MDFRFTAHGFRGTTPDFRDTAHGLQETRSQISGTRPTECTKLTDFRKRLKLSMTQLMDCRRNSRISGAQLTDFGNQLTESGGATHGFQETVQGLWEHRSRDSRTQFTSRTQVLLQSSGSSFQQRSSQTQRSQNSDSWLTEFRPTAHRSQTHDSLVQAFSSQISRSRLFRTPLSVSQ